MKQRLVEDYQKYGKLVIGLDFDNTIYDTNQIGLDPTYIIELLKDAQEFDCIICLWTLEPDSEKLAWKVNYLRDKGLKIDYINDSPILKGSRKPFFNILLDDRAGLESAYESLLYVVEHVETEFSEL